LKDIRNKGVEGVPFLRDIPYIGMLFRRDTVDFSKIDLLIFISARIIKDGEFTPEQVAQMQKNLSSIDKFGTLERDNMLRVQKQKDRERQKALNKRLKQEGSPTNANPTITN